MKKEHTFLKTIAIAFGIALMCNNTKAQWTAPGNFIYPTVLSKQVVLGATSESSLAGLTINTKQYHATNAMSLKLIGYQPRIECFDSNNVLQSYIKSVSTNDFQISTSATNQTGRVLIRTYNNANIQLMTNNITRMTVAGSGNVGIGTSSPVMKLQVEGGTDAAPSGGGFIQAGITSGLNVVLDNNEIMARNNGIASGLTLNNNGGDVVINGTNAAGNVGIGVSAPTSRLHVAGNIFASGNIDITGHLKFGSAEQFSDGGANTIASNSNIVPLTDNSSLGHLGSSSKRWFDVWAVDGTINTSDARDKNEVKNLSYGIAEIMKLRPVSYKWLSHPENGTKVGLIAQELKKVLPEVVRDFDYVTDEKSGLAYKVPSARLGVMYSDIIPVLIKGMQEQQQTIEDLKTIISSCCENNSGNGSKVPVGGLQLNENKLFQNQPNPFNQSTVVRYSLNENAGKAHIIIRDINGNLVKSIFLKGIGKGQININANELAQGTYTYSLEINAESVDTKLMVVTK